jgi:hypothetical protein
MIAASTAATVSARGLWKTPRPSIGISTPLFRVTVGMEVVISFRSRSGT